MAVKERKHKNIINIKLLIKYLLLITNLDELVQILFYKGT